MSAAEFFMTLLHAATSAHILHLQSRSFAAHSALDDLYKSLPDLTDSLIEAYQGRYEIVRDYPSGYSPPGADATNFVASLRKFVQDNRECLGKITELQNLVDEIAALIDSTLYKLRFLS